tara:strand:- start:7621 stop:8145 length:525 start_codon:yes stop_codon:yes gene_type:complete
VQLIQILFGMMIFVQSVYANPLYEVLQTCIKGTPYNHKMTIQEIEGVGPADKPLDGCENQYDRIFQGKAFGVLTCNENFYFIINDRKVNPRHAQNYSINPEIKPGVEFTSSIWYRIEYKKRAYLCIFSSLSEHGVGAAYNQYYLVENAFSSDINPKLYYYFFDKNIVPIDSKTL